MEKLKQKPVIAATTILALGIAGAAVFYTQERREAPTSPVTAKVTDVTSRPNQAEDGYLGFTVKDSQGDNYTIDATGYMNTPITPAERGEDCVKVPALQVGDQVEFKLPKDNDNTYKICYKADSGDYFIRLK